MNTRRGFLGVLAAAVGARNLPAASLTVKTANGTHELWRMAEDPLQEFLRDCCVVSPGSFVPCGEMAYTYSAWCVQANECYPLLRGAFSRRMAMSFRQVRTRFEDRQQRVWEGIALKRGVSR